MSFCSIFCRGVIKSFASPTFSGESSEWNSEINETPLAARAQPARLTKLCTTTNVDAKWGENSPSFGGAQECAIHEPLFHKEDYKLFLASLPSCSSLSFAPFGQSSPSIDQYLFGLSVRIRATGVTHKILSGRPLLFFLGGRL